MVRVLDMYRGQGCFTSSSKGNKVADSGLRARIKTGVSRILKEMHCAMSVPVN